MSATFILSLGGTPLVPDITEDGTIVNPIPAAAVFEINVRLSIFRVFFIALTFSG
jgi:hypothetical protein